MPKRKSKLTIFLLNFIPGLGHLYAGRVKRGILYPFLFFICLSFFTVLAFMDHNDEIFFFGLLIAALIWLTNMVDTLFLFANTPNTPPAVYGPYYSDAYSEPEKQPAQPESERFYTILLSFIPGLGHMHMGLMQRGLSFLIAFFGLITVLVFVTVMTGQSGFSVFLGLLPIIWLYCMFDAVQQIHRKQQGHILVDRTLFDDMEEHRVEGKRSKVLAMILSILPGAGHMYLGLQKRGLQLMIGFLGSVYILDLLHLSLFLFIIPLIWCFSFFDALQKVSRYGQEDLIDQPIVEWFANHQKWLGIGLIVIGAYYAVDKLAMELLYQYFPTLGNLLQRHLQPVLVSLVLIAGGIKLLSGKTVREKRSYKDAE